MPNDTDYTADYTAAEIAVMRQQCFAAKLENREILDKYTDAELTRIMNGIGADWMPQKLRDAISTLNPSLVPVALIHDVECHEAQQTNPTEAEFADSNRRFRCNGCRIAEFRYGWYNPKRYYVKFKAKAFAETLQQFGRGAYFGSSRNE